MVVQDSLKMIQETMNNDPYYFWGAIVLIVIVLYFILKKPKNKGGESTSTGLSPFQLEVFKRKNQ